MGPTRQSQYMKPWRQEGSMHISGNKSTEYGEDFYCILGVKAKNTHTWCHDKTRYEMYHGMCNVPDMLDRNCGTFTFYVPLCGNGVGTSKWKIWDITI